MACQGFYQRDVGDSKVMVTAAQCRDINPDITVFADHQKFKVADEVTNCIFCCVDSIETRKFIWNAVRGITHFFVDGRMSAEVIRVLTANSPELDEMYPQTLFAAAEAHQGACTAKSTIFTANICAGLMLSSFSKHLRGMPVDPDICLNLLANELTVGTEAAAT